MNINGQELCCRRHTVCQQERYTVPSLPCTATGLREQGYLLDYPYIETLLTVHGLESLSENLSKTSFYEAASSVL